MVFNVTSAAAAQILRSVEHHGSTAGLRVAAKRDTDGSIVYGMGFDDERDNDEVLQCEGLTVLIAPPSHDLLDGTTLDFVELNPGEYQFIFLNPQDAAPPPSPGGGCGSGKCGSCGG